MVDAALASGAAQRRSAFEVRCRHLPAGRRYGVVAGMARVLEAIGDFRFDEDDLAWLQSEKVVSDRTLEWLRGYRFGGDAWGMPDGEVYMPDTPLLVVEGSFAEAVLLETLVLSVLNHACAIASAASRMVNAAGGRPLIEMGSRRTHDGAAVDAALAAYVAGFAATSNLEAGRRFAIPTAGTSAHSFTLVHDDEAAAFAAQVAAMGAGTTLLVDTFDVHAGVRAAVEQAGTALGAVRLDSGDLPVLATQVRAQLDDLGAHDTRIVVTGDLDEYAIAGLAAAPVDSYGVGTKLVVGSGAPTAGLIYKLVARAVDDAPGSPLEPVFKTSSGKTGRGGRKAVARLHDDAGTAVADEVTVLPAEAATGPGLTDLSDAHRRALLVPLIAGGEPVWQVGPAASRRHHARVVGELPATARRLSPAEPALDVTVVGPTG